jgi:hypothetical protein
MASGNPARPRVLVSGQPRARVLEGKLGGVLKNFDKKTVFNLFL